MAGGFDAIQGNEAHTFINPLRFGEGPIRSASNSSPTLNRGLINCLRRESRKLKKSFT